MHSPLPDQVVTRITEVYELQLPAEVSLYHRLALREDPTPLNPTQQVQQLLGMFDIVNVNIAGLGLPLQCLGLGDFEAHLAFTMFA